MREQSNRLQRGVLLPTQKLGGVKRIRRSMQIKED
jgi:hypothetical protein